MAKVASQHGGRDISHMRSEDIYLEESIQEILEIGKQADIPVQISHFKIGLRSLWGQASKILQTRMVKKLMRPHDGSISAVHLVFRESKWGWSPSPLSSDAVAIIHCPFPDDGVPDDNAYHTP